MTQVVAANANRLISEVSTIFLVQLVKVPLLLKYLKSFELILPIFFRKEDLGAQLCSICGSHRTASATSANAIK